ncbi:MAG: histidine phosphatase family protein [Streptosporangiaceae bacterium]
MALVYLLQHAEKEAGPGDPGLTATGRAQAGRVARWLKGRDVQRLYSSPLRRARETADVIAALLGLAITTEPRLRERANWDGSCAFETFLDDWRRSVMNRDFIPPGGDSSRQAGDRMRAVLADFSGLQGTVVAVTHGGATTDALRTLLGDDKMPIGLLRDGIPPCAITTIEDMRVTGIASVAHLRSL